MFILGNGVGDLTGIHSSQARVVFKMRRPLGISCWTRGENVERVCVLVCIKHDQQIVGPLAVHRCCMHLLPTHFFWCVMVSKFKHYFLVTDWSKYVTFWKIASQNASCQFVKFQFRVLAKLQLKLFTVFIKLDSAKVISLALALAPKCQRSGQFCIYCCMNDSL